MTDPGPRVIEANLRGFVCAYAHYTETPFQLGEFVVVREGRYPVIGVVASVQSGPEDPSRSLQARGAPGETAAEVMRANPEIRLLLRTQVGVVACGFLAGEELRGGLPPLPCPLLAAVEPAGAEEIAEFAAGCGFLERLVADPEATDSTIAAALRRAAEAMGPARDAFQVAAGKELARLLRADPARLGTILRGVVA